MAYPLNELPSIRKAITLEKMSRFMGPVKESIHANPELGKRIGVGGAIVQGGHLVTFINEMMLKAFRTKYLESGSVTVKFIKPVRPGNVVSTHGKIIDTGSETSPERIQYTVWIENEDGDMVVVGSAEIDASLLREEGD